MDIFYQIRAPAQVPASGLQLPLDKPEEGKAHHPFHSSNLCDVQA